jgi:mRNA-degrading endonuclease YafQ of YafQ-DinJ toxin-antitoxin module
MKVFQTLTFLKQTKKLHKNQKNGLDEVIQLIIKDPYLGEMKKGDLIGVFVYKFKMVGQLILVAYQFNVDEESLTLLFFGSHENFYRDLKKKS